jgi:hypothetical protein
MYDCCYHYENKRAAWLIDSDLSDIDEAMLDSSSDELIATKQPSSTKVKSTNKEHQRQRRQRRSKSPREPKIKVTIAIEI